MKNAIIIYDNLHTPDLEFKQRIIDITNFYIYTPPDAPTHFDIINSSSLTNTLKDLVSQNYKWIVVNILGHCVDQLDVYYDAVKKCKELNSPMMAHIIHRSNSYPNIDDQFIILDLEKWNKIGCPIFEESFETEEVITKSILRSEENFHDDYTPYWIKSTDKDESVTFSHRPFGSKVTQAFIERGYTIINFDHELRSRKWNLYATPNYEKLNQFLKYGNVAYEEDKVPQIIERIITEKQSLTDTIYILNSESVFSNPKKYTIDHYIGVASGFKGILILNANGFHDNTEVTYLDVSTAGLDYQKYLIEHWDGDIISYQKVCNEYQALYPEYRYAWRSWNSWENEINSFLNESNISRDEFKLLWGRYKSLKHNFLNVDLLGNTDNLFDLINQVTDKQFYLWVSNAFNMQWSIFLLGKKYTSDKLNLLKENIKNTNNKFIFEEDGRYHYINCDS